MSKTNDILDSLATRRGALGLAVSAAAVAGTRTLLAQASATSTPPGPGSAPTSGPIPFGASVSSDNLPKDADYQRDDGRPNRRLPLDADYRPKPMSHVIDYFSRGRT